MRKFFVVLAASMIFAFSSSFSVQAQANTGKEFTTSVIYGTLAGTLVGAATLAFTSNPGDNLNNVARGASYGLYAGILLGIYVTYGVSDGQSEAPPATQEPGIYEGAPPPDDTGKPQGRNQKSPNTLRVALVPVVDQSRQGKTGFGAAINVFGIQF
jgi:hypothetical protein